MPRRTTRFRIPAIFGLFLCFVWGAAMLVHQSESEERLMREARLLLESHGLNSVGVSFDGSQGNLQGEVSSAELKEQAVFVVAEVQGVTAVNAEHLVVSQMPTAMAE
jgi:ribosomal protein L4